MHRTFRDLGRLLYLGCALLAATLAPAHLAAAAEQKIALVIGNSAYPTSRLRNPVNDAKAMAAKLRALGFEVALRTELAGDDHEQPETTGVSAASSQRRER